MLFNCRQNFTYVIFHPETTGKEQHGTISKLITVCKYSDFASPWTLKYAFNIFSTPEQTWTLNQGNLTPRLFGLRLQKPQRVQARRIKGEGGGGTVVARQWAPPLPIH
jgi:hypothetical protein